MVDTEKAINGFEHINEKCGGKMNDLWKDIFRKWIKSYESIMHLENEGVATDVNADNMREQLLEDIINTCISEVKE